MEAALSYDRHARSDHCERDQEAHRPHTMSIEAMARKRYVRGAWMAALSRVEKRDEAVEGEQRTDEKQRNRAQIANEFHRNRGRA